MFCQNNSKGDGYGVAARSRNRCPWVRLGNTARGFKDLSSAGFLGRYSCRVLKRITGEDDGKLLQGYYNARVGFLLTENWKRREE